MLSCFKIDATRPIQYHRNVAALECRRETVDGIIDFLRLNPLPTSDALLKESVDLVRELLTDALEGDTIDELLLDLDAASVVLLPDDCEERLARIAERNADDMGAKIDRAYDELRDKQTEGGNQ